MERAKAVDLREDEPAADAVAAPGGVDADGLQLGARAQLVADLGPEAVADRADDRAAGRLGDEEAVEVLEDVAEGAHKEGVGMLADEPVDRPRVLVHRGPDAHRVAVVVLHGAGF